MLTVLTRDCTHNADYANSTSNINNSVNSTNDTKNANYTILINYYTNY